jgi:hypothetical protein
LKYLDYLEKKDDITTTEGESVEVFELNNGIDSASFEEWAISFRQNYCSDDILELLIKGTGLTKEEYLLTNKFPDKTEGFGPGTRSGDFAELLIADYLEFCLGYTVHRERYKNKFNRSSSTQGTDVIGFKILGAKDSADDELVTFEVKAQASGTKPARRLQDAIDDSLKDPVRKGETLSALKQLYIEKNYFSKALQVERFQNKPDRPYLEKYGSAAVHDTKTFSEATIKEVSAKGSKRWLIVMHRDNLMELVHELYKRAAQC